MPLTFVCCDDGCGVNVLQLAVLLLLCLEVLPVVVDLRLEVVACAVFLRLMRFI